MKTLKTIILISFLIVGFISFSQTNRTIHRIDLKERSNLYLKNVVKALLDANCEGKLTSFYPKNPDIKLEFSVLTNYFGIKIPAVKTENNYFITNCCNNSLCNISLDDLARFLHYIEVVEDKKNTSNGIQREVVYIRLVYAIFDGNGNFLGVEKGPLFYFKDIKNSFLSVKNPKNRTKIMVSLIFDGHLYNDIIINKDNQYIEYRKGKIIKIESVNHENDMWVK